MIKRILQMSGRFISNPEIRFNYLAKIGLFDRWSDERFLKKQYYLTTGKKLDLEHPQTFNEKLQWLKIHDRNSVYTTMVDKHAVKEYVAGKIGGEYIIPTLGVWSHFNEIDFEKLPEQFVLKCTHDSGGIAIITDKAGVDKRAVRKKLENSLKQNYYYLGREWPYKNVPPRIIAEPYLVDESGKELKDYKIFCFNGEPKLVQVDFGRFDVHRRNLYTIGWDYVDASIKFPKDPDTQIPRPPRLEKMLEIAGILSEGIPHVRVDLYSVNGRIYFGELTMYHGGGLEKFTPEELEMRMGEWITLP